MEASREEKEGLLLGRSSNVGHPQKLHSSPHRERGTWERAAEIGTYLPTYQVLFIGRGTQGNQRKRCGAGCASPSRRLFVVNAFKFFN